MVALTVNATFECIVMWHISSFLLLFLPFSQRKFADFPSSQQILNAQSCKHHVGT